MKATAATIDAAAQLEPREGDSALDALAELRSLERERLQADNRARLEREAAERAESEERERARQAEEERRARERAELERDRDYVLAQAAEEHAARLGAERTVETLREELARRAETEAAPPASARSPLRSIVTMAAGVIAITAGIVAGAERIEVKRALALASAARQQSERAEGRHAAERREFEARVDAARATCRPVGSHAASTSAPMAARSRLSARRGRSGAAASSVDATHTRVRLSSECAASDDPLCGVTGRGAARR